MGAEVTYVCNPAAGAGDNFQFLQENAYLTYEMQVNTKFACAATPIQSCTGNAPGSGGSSCSDYKSQVECEDSSPNALGCTWAAPFYSAIDSDLRVCRPVECFDVGSNPAVDGMQVT